MNPLREEDGQVLVLAVVCMAVLLGFVALAIDVGQLLLTKRQLQTAADAAAIAGALEIQQCGSISNCPAMQDAAISALGENGLPNPTLETQCAGNSKKGLTLTLNNGPCLLGYNDPNFANSSYVEAVVTEQQPMFFASVLGIKPMTVIARSEAGLGAPPGCVIALNQHASQTILSNGNSDLEADCPIVDDSNSSTALLVNGNAKLISTASISVVGNDLINGNPTVSPTPTLNAPLVPDPFADLPAPTVGSCDYTNVTVNKSQNKNSTVTLNPGVYCGLSINGQANVTFSPGLYIMNGNTIVNGGATIAGTGVTFYIASGQWIMNGGSATHGNLVAPTTGTYAGILFFQARTDSNQFILNGDSSSAWQGAIYIPDGNLLLNGGSNVAAYTIVVADTITVNGNNKFTIGDDYSSLPGGPPMHGRRARLME